MTPYSILNRRSRQSASWLVVLLLVHATSALAAKSLRLDASPGETLQLKLKAGGDVTINGSGSGSVDVQVSGRSANSRDFSITLERQGNGLVLAAKYLGDERSWSSDLSFDITVPTVFDVAIDSTGGAVEVADVRGEVSGRTMGGALTLRRLVGVAKLETMGGNILVEDSELDGKVSTMGGKVTLRDIVGDLEGSSMGGNVSLVRVTRRNGTNSGETLNISTMGGAVEVDEAPAGARLKTMGGNINVNSAREFVDAETMGGNVTIKSVEGWVKAVTMGGNVDVRVVGEGTDGADITLKSLSGDVRLVVPRGFGMQLDIELEFTKRHEGKHEIRTDLAIQQSQTPNWSGKRGQERKTITGTGTIGDGRHRVKIRTINGDVVISEG